jgi:hypothetical protein
VYGELTDAQKAKTISALRNAMNNTQAAVNSKATFKFCDSYSLTIAGDYQILSSKGLSKELQGNFASALRAFLRVPRLPGEIQIRCQGK